jgi:hypothetical protein
VKLLKGKRLKPVKKKKEIFFLKIKKFRLKSISSCFFNVVFEGEILVKELPYLLKPMGRVLLMHF